MALDSLMSTLTDIDSIVVSTDSIAAKVFDKTVVTDLIDQGISLGISLGLKILIAILIYAVGKWLISRLKSLLHKVLVRHDAEPSLQTFLRSLVSVILNVLLVLTIISVLGINVTSFLALFGAAGVAVGLALSSTLQNFANGVIILLLKPYKVGDFIKAQGESGTVSAIQITTTELLTIDQRVIIIPNGSILSGVIENISKMDKRRVDWSFSIAYGDDYDSAKQHLLSIMAEDTRILQDPAPFVGLGAMADSALQITVRAWVNAADYWDVFFSMNEKVYKTFPEKGLSIPFPQMDVHVHQEK